MQQLCWSLCSHSLFFLDKSCQGKIYCLLTRTSEMTPWEVESDSQLFLFKIKNLDESECSVEKMQLIVECDDFFSDSRKNNVFWSKQSEKPATLTRKQILNYLILGVGRLGVVHANEGRGYCFLCTSWRCLYWQTSWLWWTLSSQTQQQTLRQIESHVETCVQLRLVKLTSITWLM